MTVKQAALRLHLAVPTVYDLVRAGMIPARRLGVKGGRIWLDPEDVDAYWDRSKVTTSDRPLIPRLDHMKPFRP